MNEKNKLNKKKEKKNIEKSKKYQTKKDIYQYFLLYDTKIYQSFGF